MFQCDWPSKRGCCSAGEHPQSDNFIYHTTILSHEYSTKMWLAEHVNKENVTYFLKWLQNDTAKDLIILEMRTLIHQGKHPTMKLLLHMLW